MSPSQAVFLLSSPPHHYNFMQQQYCLWACAVNQWSNSRLKWHIHIETQFRWLQRSVLQLSVELLCIHTAEAVAHCSTIWTALGWGTKPASTGEKRYHKVKTFSHDTRLYLHWYM